MKLRLVLIVFVVWFVSCGGGINVKRAENYKVVAPLTWDKYEDGESDSSFRLEGGRFVTLTSSCGRDATQPLQRLTSHLLMGVREIRYAKQERVLASKDSEGLYSSVQAKFEDKPIWLDIVVMKNRDCVFDFVLTGNKPLGKAEHEEFMAFVKSLEARQK